MRWGLAFLIGLVAVWPVKGEAQTLPEPVFKTFSEMPQDAQAVVASIVDRVSGGAKPVASVRFGRSNSVAPEAANYAGFVWRASSLFGYGETAGNASGRTIRGVFELDDAMGRKAAVLFDAAYTVAGNVLEVSALTMAPHFVAEPRSAMFVLPADTLTGAQGPVPDGHAALYRFALEHAVSWSRPEQVVAGERDYAVVVFLLDRISPSAAFEVKLSDKPSSPDGFAGASRYLNDGDWRLGVVAGKFALDTVKLYVKAVVTPGSEQGALARQPAVMGLYALNSFAAEGAQQGLAFREAPAGQGLSLNRFDGRWKFKLRMRGGNVQCDGVEWKNSTVSSGKIVGELYHGQVGSIPLTGTVSPTGQVAIEAYNGFVTGSASGQVDGDTASGKFDARVDIENCRGNWTAARIAE